MTDLAAIRARMRADYLPDEAAVVRRLLREAGLAAEARAGIAAKAAELVTRVRDVLGRVGLPVQLGGYDAQTIIAAMGHDKKRVGKTIRFIIPQALGDVVIIDNPGWEHVEAALGKILV